MNPAAARFLGALLEVQIDRPRGSRHPEHGFVYPVNYGYLPGEIAPDGEPLDAYVLGVAEPVTSFRGECSAVIHRLDDEDDKLIVVPAGQSFTDEEIRAATHFQEQYFESVIVRSNGLI